MPSNATLFFVDADAFLSVGGDGLPLTELSEGAAEIRITLAKYHTDWLAGDDHAPPWRIVRGGLGFIIAPIRAPDVQDGYQIAPSVVGGGRALSVTLDQHSLAGVRSMTILHLLAQFALDLSEAMGSRWMGWGPALVAYPPDFLKGQMASWAHSGLMPLLAFLRFDEGAAGQVATSGLGFFALPDIRFSASPDMHRADAVRRMIRLAYALLADSQAVQDGQFAGLIAGEILTLRWRRGSAFGAYGVVEVISQIRNG